MTPSNVDYEVLHKLFYEQCLKDLKVEVHNKCAEHASSAIQDYMAKISIEGHNAVVKQILTKYGFEPSSECIQKVSLSSSTVKQLHPYKPTKRDDEHIRKTLICLYYINPAHQADIILRTHLAKLFKIELTKFNEEFPLHALIYLGKNAELYFCIPTHCRCCKMFTYTDKTYMTLGYIAKLFQSNTTEFEFHTQNTNFYDRYERDLMVIPHHIEFVYDHHHYIVLFNCRMNKGHINKRTSKFIIGNPIKYTKSRPGVKTEGEMKYTFLQHDIEGEYYDRESCYPETYVVLTDDFEYKFDSFEEGSKASQQMKELLDKHATSNSHMSFFHYFLTLLPIEKQLLFVVTYFTRQSVYRDFF
jgi:hypothetical protein